MKEELEKIREKAVQQITEAGNLDALNDIRVSFLGKKGELKEIMKSMKDVSPEERPNVGKMVNEARDAIEERLAEAKEKMEEAAMEAKLRAEKIDVTLPAKKNKIGNSHPNTMVLK